MTPAGIYIHIPFCERKCPYCDFYSTTGTHQIAAYIQSLECEIKMAAVKSVVVDSIYLGGGTPSLLTADQVRLVIEGLRSRYTVSRTAEITIEINPGRITARKLSGYRQSGVNRLNIGVQSFSDTRLQQLGRTHSAADGRQAIGAARRAGFDNIGVDLIYGISGQTPADWRQDLEAAAAAAPEHIACYMLTYEPRTLYYSRLRQGRMHPLPEEQVADMFLLAAEKLGGKGYTHYEISNFARIDAGRRQDFTSRHNFKYWSQAPYRGYGPAAHSLLGQTRFWNVASLKKYIRRVSMGRLPVEGTEALTVAQQMIEALYLGLRTRDGIDIAAFNRRFDTDFRSRFGPSLDSLAAEGLMYVDAQTCRLSLQGMLFHNAVAGQLIGAVD